MESIIFSLDGRVDLMNSILAYNKIEGWGWILVILFLTM